jgi:hypothetical protein
MRLLDNYHTPFGFEPQVPPLEMPPLEIDMELAGGFKSAERM